MSLQSYNQELFVSIFILLQDPYGVQLILYGVQWEGQPELSLPGRLPNPPAMGVVRGEGKNKFSGKAANPSSHGESSSRGEWSEKGREEQVCVILAVCVLCPCGSRCCEAVICCKYTYYACVCILHVKLEV